MFEKKTASDRTQEPSSHQTQRPDAAAAGQAAGGRGREPSHRDGAVIGPSIHIDGDLRGEEDLLIQGEVKGTVQLKSHSLTIGGQGKVRANVYAHSIYVDGFMEGDLHGAECVYIRKTAEVRGNITSPRVSLEDGAKFKGSIEMDSQALEATHGPGRDASKRPSAVASQGSGADGGLGKPGAMSATAVKTGKPELS